MLLPLGGSGTVQVAEYDLFIDLDFTNLKFKGKLLIKLKTEEDILLNSVGLNIERVSSGESVFRFSQIDENLTIETGPFDGTLQINYAAAIPNSLAGIYSAPYDHTHIVTTHFEAAQARRMFPCVDRPDVKAEFKLAVKIDKGLEAISNMPVQSVSEDAREENSHF